MSAARDRETDAHRRLRHKGRGHIVQTLHLLAAHALTEGRDDNHPRGWVAASRNWLHERTGLTTKTITAHISGLIAAGELIEWEPARPRSGRSREYVVVWMAGARLAKQAEMRAYRRRTDSLRRNGQQGNYWGKSTTPDGPLRSLPADRVETAESRETATPQRPAGEVGEFPLVVSTRQSGRDNTERETVDPVPSVTVPATRNATWSDHVAQQATASLQGHPISDLRAVSVGLGRALDYLTIEQGSEAADAVFDRAVTRSHSGEALATALRAELKDALGLYGHDGEQHFTDILTDRTIPMTHPPVTDLIPKGMTVTNDNNAPHLTLVEAQRIVAELQEPPEWMQKYDSLPAYMRYLIDEFDDETSHALLDELTGLLMIDEDQADRIHAAETFARRWSGHDARCADWWLLVAEWLNRRNAAA